MHLVVSYAFTEIKFHVPKILSVCVANFNYREAHNADSLTVW